MEKYKNILYYKNDADVFCFNYLPFFCIESLNEKGIKNKISRYIKKRGI